MEGQVEKDAKTEGGVLLKLLCKKKKKDKVHLSDTKLNKNATSHATSDLKTHPSIVFRLN